MWGLPPHFASLDTNEKYALIGQPKKFVCKGTWKPADIVQDVEIPRDLLEPKAYLGDFGLAMKSGTPVSCKYGAPWEYCAPERFHGYDPSFASDMWSYMHLFVRLYLGSKCFLGWGGKHTPWSWVSILGGMPAEWKGKYPLQGIEDRCYDPETASNPKTDLPCRIASHRPETSQEERQHVLSVMLRGLCYLPDKRITTAQLLEDVSFNAIMRIYGCC